MLKVLENLQAMFLGCAFSNALLVYSGTTPTWDDVWHLAGLWFVTLVLVAVVEVEMQRGRGA